MFFADWLAHPFFFFIPVIIFVAYIIFGMTGFGSAVICVPLLAYFFPLKIVIPFVCMLDVLASGWTGLKNIQHIDKKEVSYLVPFMLIGITLGTTLLVNLSQRHLLIALAIFIFSYGGYLFLNPHIKKQIDRKWISLFGVSGGIFGALFGTGGPIYMIYLSNRLTHTGQLRATMSVIISVSTILRVALFALSGLLWQEMFVYALPIAIILMFAGLKIGHHFHAMLSRAQLIRVIAFLLLGNGLLLILKSFNFLF